MTSTQLQNTFFLVVLFGATALFLWMLGSYLFPVFWAIVIAITFFPIYKWLLKLLGGRRNIASLLAVLITITAIIVPLITVSGLVLRESFSIYQSISSGVTDQTIAGTVNNLNGWLPIDADINYVENQVREYATATAEAITGSLVQYSQLTLEFMIKIAITLYLLFFMFKYNREILGKTVEYLPMDEKYLQMLFERFSSTTGAIMQGTMTIAILQGVIGGLVLWMAGIPAPALWGVVITILSIIPAAGPSFVMIPAGVILILSGSVWQGALVIGTGLTLVALVDDFLRPILVGRKAKIPDAFVLLATFGGLATFGITGFVIGPVVAAFCLSLWAIFSQKYHGSKS